LRDVYFLKLAHALFALCFSSSLRLGVASPS
jgi:hypothetical protein